MSDASPSLRTRPSACVFLLLLACNPAGSDTEMRVLAGLDTIPAVELVRVGGPEAAGAAAFVAKTAVQQARDGLVYVLDGRRLDVTVFDESGAVVRQFGGRGQGPGELASASRMGSFADTVWVLDWLRQTTHFFDRNGAFLDFRRVAVDLDSTRFAGSTLPLAYTSAGLVVFEPDPLPVEVPDATGPVVLAGLDGTAGDTILTRAVWRGRVPVPGAGALRIANIDSYVLFAAAPDGERLVAVHRAPGADGVPEAGSVHITVWDARGETVLSRSLAGFARRAVTTAERDSVVRGATAVLERTINQLPELRTAVRDPGAVMGSVLRVPDDFPPVSDLRVTSDGGIWLRLAHQGANQHWLVLNDSAEPRYVVQLPPDFTLHDAGGSRAWGVAMDSLDVQYLVGLELNEGSR